MNDLPPNWQINTDQQRLEREYRFASFADTLAFMVRVGVEAEKLDHHPDWDQRYNKLIVHLSTHSKGQITKLDYQLAEKMEAIALRYGEKTAQ